MNGGVQYVPQLASVPQIVFLDFDGALTSYHGEELTVNNVEVRDPQLTEERIVAILSELNSRYAAYGVTFVAERPLTGEYSTVYVGPTDAFAPYGPFAGLAETVDSGNQNRSDNAFVMLDHTADDGQIIALIGHETEHLLGILDHGGEGLSRFAGISPGTKILDVYTQSSGYANNCSVMNGGHLIVAEKGSTYLCKCPAGR